jgi:hypothetical protein
MAQGTITIWRGNGIGIQISKDGVKIIGPCDPELLAAMKAIAATQSLPAAVRRESAAFTTRLGSFVFEGIDKAVGGGLDATSGVVYSEDGDGFTCGSTGKPPIPLPRQRGRVPVDKVVTG